MSETLQNNPHYLKHHPDAIQDGDRAHRMALSGNRHRSVAARYRASAELAFKLSLKDGDDRANFNNAYDEVAEALEEKPDNRDAQNRLDTLHRIPRTDDLDASIKLLKENASEYDQIADDTERVVDTWGHRE